MALWVDSLRSKEVVITGDFRQTFLNLTRSELARLLKSHGAIVVDDVRKRTDLLIRADSPAWLYDSFGQREAELAQHQRQGRVVGVLDVNDLQQLLAGNGVWARSPMSPPDIESPIGRPYVSPPQPACGWGDDEQILFERDPAAMERALAGHARTQDLLAEFIRSKGMTPMSPTSSVAQFDLAWTVGSCLWIAEVKSLTRQNEDLQLRLGLGQVLEYAWRLRQVHDGPVRAVLVPETSPTESMWPLVCAEAGVVLAWPKEFSTLEPEMR